jgi:hypothetical protein
MLEAAVISFPQKQLFLVAATEHAGLHLKMIKRGNEEK